MSEQCQHEPDEFLLILYNSHNQKLHAAFIGLFSKHQHDFPMTVTAEFPGLSSNVKRHLLSSPTVTHIIFQMEMPFPSPKTQTHSAAHSSFSVPQYSVPKLVSLFCSIKNLLVLIFVKEVLTTYPLNTSSTDAS